MKILATLWDEDRKPVTTRGLECPDGDLTALGRFIVAEAERIKELTGRVMFSADIEEVEVAEPV